MADSSARSSYLKRRVNSYQDGNRNSSISARRRKKSIDNNDAYLHALRVAYLAYLLQPKAKRTIPKPPLARTQTASTSVHDLVKDLSLVRDSKTTKTPHDFVKELDKRLQRIIVGTDKRPEFQDASCRRSFAVFYNQLQDPKFKKQMEEGRRAEDLVLIFFSHATKEMQKGKPPGDEGVKRSVDRHVALFVRLMNLTLKETGRAPDKPDLVARLQTLESKLMKHEEDLTTPTSADSSTVEEEVPLSYKVEDMPLVQVVGQIFGLRSSMLQSDIDKNKVWWTEWAALQDLKTYQAHLNVGTKLTLNSRDFDTQEAYEAWKKAETPLIPQMVLAIIGANPTLAKTLPLNGEPEMHSQNASNGIDYAGISRQMSFDNELDSASPTWSLNTPADFGSLSLEDRLEEEERKEKEKQGSYVFTFIPSDARSYFRYITKQALEHDLKTPLNDDSDPTTGLFSKATTELLNEIGLRWRLPHFSRIVLFLDVVKEKFVNSEIDLETLDKAFNWVKAPVTDDKKNKRASLVMTSVLHDRYKWTIADFSLMQQVISSVYEVLLTQLFDAFMTCFDAKPSPLLGMILEVIDEHIRNDPSFNQPTELFEQFKAHVTTGLQTRAGDMYTEAVEKALPEDQNSWVFLNIIELKKSILKMSERVQKRYKKSPEIMGIQPQHILWENVLPNFANDSKAISETVMENAKIKGQEVPVQDGFDLYKELSEFRGVYLEAVPGAIFPYSLEEMLQEFVWKWIRTTEAQVVGWVENAVKNDHFTVRAPNPSNEAPTQDERHSVSVIDVFQIFSTVIDQFEQLRWDDDLTYAKFMTSISKGISTGINRYCDLLDQMFSREMDRMTPEQESAANQTRQERWIQLARDTWNQKDRVEPFNFYRESFVKLNDISFAINQWDRLEQDVNVDACADVIKRNAPKLVTRQPKYSNYVFTIKIVEAEDIKACDVNGFSDPYIVLTDEYQKRLFKSKVVYRSLNPRFDESQDITTQGPLNVIATLWDWDSIGDHDYIGRTSLKLDPTHFGDFLPREYWLDLDTQGRILVRVSMEGERDDIQFYFAKAFRALQRTQRDMTRKITDKLTAYINHCLSRRTLRNLLSRGIANTASSAMSSVSSYFGRNRNSGIQISAVLTDGDVLRAVEPLFNYFDDNFAIMQQTLTADAMIAVMTRLWKEVLATIETLLVPPLSDKPSSQKPLNQQELDVVYKWLQLLLEFFYADGEGVEMKILKNPKYSEICTINFFYFSPTEDLIRESERMVSASTAQKNSRLSAPAAYGNASGLLVAGSTSNVRRAKSIMHSRNLGTMRKAKEEKWKAAQAEPSDDMILRILRMRPEASNYLRDRSRQKERLAAAAAAEMIVRQSLAAGGGRMTGPSVVRR